MKKVENHVAAVSLHSMYYNFVRIHKTLKVSPAMAAGVTDRLWEMSDIVEMLEAFETKGKRDAKPIFEILEWRIGGGFSIRATIPNREPEQIDGFATRNEAAQWVRHESQLWLSERAKAPVVPSRR